jgi:hypothetical protein
MTEIVSTGLSFLETQPNVLEWQLSNFHELGAQFSRVPAEIKDLRTLSE